MRIAFVTASRVLSVRNCLESVCGSMVLGVSSTRLIRMDRVLSRAVFTEIRRMKIQMNSVHCSVFTERENRKRNKILKNIFAILAFLLSKETILSGLVDLLAVFLLESYLEPLFQLRMVFLRAE